MQGRHFGIGPWFTVQKENEWNKLDSFLLSNGRKNIWACLEVKLGFAQTDADSLTLPLATTKESSPPALQRSPSDRGENPPRSGGLLSIKISKSD